MEFDQLGLSTGLLRAVTEAGYNQPTPIQQKAIPVVFMGCDILGCAQTGTGKTASFTLPMLDILAEGTAKARMPRALILEPTRELATQVADNFDKYGKFHSLSKVVLIGGRGFADQERLLERGVDALIATPGRLLDLFERGKILLNDTRYLVIDEADRMLDMGFIPDVEKIVSLMPVRRQTLLFSATMPTEIRRLADAFLNQPREITISRPSTAAVTVNHSLTVVGPRRKSAALRVLIQQQDIDRAIVFCNRKKDISSLTRELKKDGIDVCEMHGDMSQPRREETLNGFRAGEIKLLIASDVAARGIDVREISHVFNYDVPHNPEDYIHRIGRTGRAGSTGYAFTLATPEDYKAVDLINQMLGKNIDVITLPGFTTIEFDETRADSHADSSDSPNGPKKQPRRRNRTQNQKNRHQRSDNHPSQEAAAEKKTNSNGLKRKGEKRKSTPKKNDPKLAPSSDQKETPVAATPVGMGDHLPDFLARDIPNLSEICPKKVKEK